MSMYKSQATTRVIILRLSFKVLIVQFDTFFSMIAMIHFSYYFQDFATYIWLFNYLIKGTCVVAYLHLGLWIHIDLEEL